MSENLQDHARKLETQFQFYAISLMFTLLAASVQTAELGKSNFEDITEISSWTCLLSSGLLALSYAEWSAIIYRHIGIKHQLSNEVVEAEVIRKGGVASSMITRTYQNSLDDEAITERKGIIDIHSAKIKNLGTRNVQKYNASKYLFTFGLVLVVVSRSLAAIASLFEFKLL